METAKSKWGGVQTSLFACFLLSGCATTAATEIVASAKTYEARSLEAIGVFDAALAKELAPGDIPDSEAEAAFVNSIMGSKRTVFSLGEIETALRPYSFTPDASVAAQQQAFAALRGQHARFTAAFDHVERAGLLGKRAISRCAPRIVSKLVARQVYLAKSLRGDGEIRLLVQRNMLAAQIAAVKNNVVGDDAAKRVRLVMLRRNWIAMEAEEHKLNADTITALMSAAQSGMMLRKQVDDYGKVSLADIQVVASGILAFASSSTGRDLTALHSNVDTVFERLKSDPDFSQAAHILLAAAQDAAETSDGEDDSCVASAKGK